MMNFKIYSIFDKKAGLYGMPFFMLNDSLAVRDLQNSLKKSDSPYGSNPEDFQLYCVGDFKPETGLISQIDTGCPVLIGELASYMPS